MHTIERLDARDFEKCASIWNLKKHAELAKRFRGELVSGNRLTYIYKIDGEFIAEISLVLDMNDSDYTVKGRRACVSHLVVKNEYRRRGIGRSLIDYVSQTASNMGLCELSVGVDIENYPAVKLYFETGFSHILFIGEDADGKYFKLLKKLN